MAKELDNAHLIERELDNRICLNILALFALIFSATFVVVTTLAFLNIRDIDDRDNAVRLQIEKLQEKLRTYRKTRGQLVDGTHKFIEEIAQAAENGAVFEMDQHVDESAEDERTSKNDDAQERGRRQQTNIFEAILTAQRVVFERHCVSHDTPCPKGRRGENGTIGDAGLGGTNGTDGTNGTKGMVGDTGNPGLRGEIGSKVQGDSGINGTDGLIGDTGAWGVNGLPGVNGSAGQKGLQGDIGIKGLIGDTGFWGENGTQGVNGTKGPIGDPGLTGMNGTQGDTGPRGQDVKKFADDCQCYKKPIFKNSNDQTVVVGSSDKMVIPCVGEGNPPPSVTLHKLPQKNGRKRTITQSGNVFTLDKPSDRDYGRYVCTATNIYGTATKVVTVSKPTSGK
ncbi:collagen alpha-1(IV) chain-like [Mercenaria mercenaria]|uniref:collagen alpha-1(IV) chain-like n=1 Tax=Mercenaria mercenaria TaxID=6596 RepID=UPI00234E6214|nr:collagen alpha-1(IV) chain-like [Mercenaria mercenaria]